MSRRGLVLAVIGELCAGMGLETPGLDADDRLTLNFGQVPVTLAFGTDPMELLWVHAALGEIPEDGPAGPTFLMHLAFESWTLNRGTIGLDPDGQRVWLYSCVPVVQLTKEVLEQTLTAMLEAAIPIRDRIANRQFEILGGSRTQPDPGSGLTRV